MRTVPCICSYLFAPILLVSASFAQDTDFDGIADDSDNCIETPNGPIIPDAGGNSQLDVNGDGYGNACDADLNDDGLVNGLDVGPFLQQFSTAGPDADFNGDFVVNGLDVGPFVSMFGQGPGPAAAGQQIQAIELLTSSPQLPSDQSGGTSVTITAIASNANGDVMEGVAIAFSATSGLLQITQAITNASGVATAELSNGSDLTNRVIGVSATGGEINAMVNVAVVGTRLRIFGPDALSISDSGTYTLLLEDSLDIGIEGESVDVTSANGNTLSATSLTTGGDGDAQLMLTGIVAGNDTLSATALDTTAMKSINISNDNFSILTPVENAEIPISTDQTVRLEWTLAGTPVVGETINFSSTRGTLSSSSAVTDIAGQATVTINSNTAGPAVITATNANATMTTVTVEFTASVAADLSLQASPSTVAVGQQSEIVAVLRDPSGNFVKNKVVVFGLTDPTNGFLSVGSTITDSQGTAETLYNAGNVPGAVDDVVIHAFVQDTPAVEATIFLTVTQLEIDLFIGTSDVLFLPDPARYTQEWVVLATDTLGNPIENTVIQATLRSVRYYKGQLVLVAVGADINWVQNVTAPPFCLDEDTNGDGILDLVSEDFNGNGTLEAGNVATLFAVPENADPDDPCALAPPGGQGTDVVTDAHGFARVCVIYPRSVNLWADVELTAQLNVFGSEFSDSQQFQLRALASDLLDENSEPAGRISPFGTASTCANPN